MKLKVLYDRVVLIVKITLLKFCSNENGTYLKWIVQVTTQLALRVIKLMPYRITGCKMNNQIFK